MKPGDRCLAYCCVSGRTAWMPGGVVAITKAPRHHTTVHRERYTVRTDDGVEHRGLSDVRVAETIEKPRRKARRTTEATA